MSNPYDILKPAKKSIPPRGSRPPPPGGSEKEKSKQPLSTATKRKPVERPRNLRYVVKPRFRFDLPEPPMDMKMMLGRLPTSHYADAFSSELEQNFKPVLHPASLTFGIEANLVDPSIYTKPASLSIEDQALIQGIFAKHKGVDVVAEATDKAQGKKKGSRAPRVSDTIDAPWMRRMSYDEYLSQDTGGKRKSAADQKDFLSRRKPQESSTKLKQQHRRSVANSFKESKISQWKHPDPRKANVTPVSVSPIFPDFNLLGERFMILEFDNEEQMTVATRLKKKPEVAEESLRSTATVPINAAPKKNADPRERKHVAMYTPTVKTLQKRKSKQEQEGDDDDEPGAKRIHYSEVEQYQWMSEYAIRELDYDDPKKAVSRSVFAVTEHKGKDGKSFATFAKVDGAWKMSKRSIISGVLPLGRDGLRITRDLDKKTGNNRVRRAFISGAFEKKDSADRKVKSEKQRKIELLES